MADTCRCLFPAVAWDREICQATGGECIPEALEGPFSAPQVPTGAPVHETRSCADCAQGIQRVMNVPFGWDEQSLYELEDPDTRPYVWEW
jgi:hypothetical protein